MTAELPLKIPTGLGLKETPHTRVYFNGWIRFLQTCLEINQGSRSLKEGLTHLSTREDSLSVWLTLAIMQVDCIISNRLAHIYSLALHTYDIESIQPRKRYWTWSESGSSLTSSHCKLLPTETRCRESTFGESGVVITACFRSDSLTGF